MKNWRGKRILGLFLSVALVLSTLDVSTLTVTAQEGTVSEGIASGEEAESAETVSVVSYEETEAAVVESEISSEEIEQTEVESTEASEETEQTEVESSTVSEETESVTVESTEVNEETESVEVDATVVGEEVEATEVESTVEVEKTEESQDDEIEADGVATVTVVITSQPGSQSITYGDVSGATFKVAAKADNAPDDATFSFQWSRADFTNGSGNYVDISGATAQSYTEKEKLPVGEYRYKCSVSCEGDTAVSTPAILTVNKVDTTFNSDSLPTIAGEYGQTLYEMAEASLTGEVESSNGVKGTWQLKDVAGAITVYPTVARTTAYEVVFKPADSRNYSEYSTSVYPTVIAKKIVVSINDVEKEYGEDNPTISEKDITYEKADLCANDSFSDLGITFTHEADKTSGVDTYDITGKWTNINYNITINKGTLTIKKKSITVTAKNKEIKFNEDIPELDYSYNLTDLVGDDKYKPLEVLGVELTVNAKKGDAVGNDYVISLKNTTSENYDVTVIPATLTIIPADTTFDEEALKEQLTIVGTYGQTLQDMFDSEQSMTTAPEKSIEGWEGTWSVSTKEAGAFPTVKGTKAYTLVFTPKDPNYAEYSTTVIPTVEPKTITATVKDAERAYKEPDPIFTIEYAGALEGDEFVETFTTDAKEESPVGTYKVTAKAENSNYIIDGDIVGTLTIVQAEVEFAKEDVPSIMGTYGNTLGEMTVSGSTTSLNGAEGTWDFADTVKADDAVMQSYPTVTGDTAYAVVFTPKDTTNYKTYETTVIPTVAKKKIEIQVANKEKVYGAENPVFNFTYSKDGLAGTDTEKDINDVLGVTLTTEATATSPVTEEGYQITGTSESDNYEVIIIPGTLMITQKPFTVKADDKERAYGEENPEFTFSFDETQYQLVGEDTKEDLGVVLTTTATKESPVTEEGYPITGDETTNTNSNYVVTVEPGKLEIVKADIVFSEEDVLAITGIYGKTVAEMEVTGPATSQNGATGKWSLDLDNIDEKAKKKLLTVDAEPEEYPVKFTPDDTVNYNVYPNPLTPQEPVTALTAVSPKEITVQADDKTKVYGTENPELTFTYKSENLVQGDTVEDLEITLSTTATVDSVGRKGGYPITGTSASVNYAVTVIPGKLTITQAEAFITIEYGKDSYTKSYGGDDFKLEGITTNSDGAFEYTLSGGMDADGQPKAEEDIITVSSDGIVSIQGSGKVIITVTTKETLNFKEPEPKQITVQVVKKDGFFIKELPEVTYTGKAIQPDPVVYDGATERKLVKGTDYTISYKNSVNAYDLRVGDAGFKASKAPQIIIKGKGNYTQKLTVYYTIQPRSINDLSVLANDIALVANGKVQTKVPVITYNNKNLSGVKKAAKGKTNTKGKDFIYYYPALNTAETKDTAFKEKGTYRIVVQGTGNYTGTRIVKLTITDEGLAIDNAFIEEIPDKPYQYGAAITLDKTELVVKTEVNGEVVELEKDKDYTVKYRNNIDVGTATVIVSGINKYAGTQTANFKIAGKSLDDVEISGLQDKEYNGTEQTQRFVLTSMSAEGETIRLIQGKDYIVTYKNNKNVGTAEATIQGKGAYNGTVKMKFKITAYDISYETDSEGNRRYGSRFTEPNGLLEKKDGELAVKYTKGGTKPKMQLLFNGEELVEGKDYTATYKNNKVITAEGTKKIPVVTIKGKGNFKGSFKKTYVVVSKTLDDSEVPVTMTVADKAVSGKAGGYISKPVVTDANGKVLKAGKDYSKPVYSVDGRTLDKSSTVGVGKVVTVTVKGMGVYSGGTISATYRITNKNFNSVKIKSIQKEYRGEEIILTEEDFKNEDGTSKITFGKNKEALVLGEDFEIVEGSYKNNLKKGTASVTLRGLGEYGGTKTIKFKIKARGLFRR